MTAPELKGKLAFGTAVPLAITIGWCHGLRTVGELLPSVLAAGVLVPLPSVLLGLIGSLLASVLLLGPFTLRAGTVEAANVVLDWGGHLLVVAALTFGVVAVGARVVTPSGPPDLRLWALVADAARGAAALTLGWLALASLLEVRRRIVTARDLRAARALGGAPQRARAGLAGAKQGAAADDGPSREAGERSRRTHHTDLDAALERCAVGLARWEERPLQRSRAAVELAALRASLLVERSPQDAAAGFADLAEQVAWSPDRVDLVARAADAAGLPASGLQAWLLAVRVDPETRDRALDEVARRAAALATEGADAARRETVLGWLRGEAAKARERRDQAELDALAALAERLGATALAREVRAD